MLLVCEQCTLLPYCIKMNIYCLNVLNNKSKKDLNCCDCLLKQRLSSWISSVGLRYRHSPSCMHIFTAASHRGDSCWLSPPICIIYNRDKKVACSPADGALIKLQLWCSTLHFSHHTSKLLQLLILQFCCWCSANPAAFKWKESQWGHNVSCSLYFLSPSHSGALSTEASTALSSTPGKAD